MILRTVFIAFAIFSIVFGLNAQTSESISSKYPKGAYFEVRPNIMMLLDENGNTACSAVFQPSRLSRQQKTSFIGNDWIEPDQLIEIFDELVPVATRKGEMKDFGWLIQGTSFSTGVSWDNVRFNVQYFVGRSRGGIGNLGKSTGIERLFPNPKYGPDIASITWLDPSCEKTK